MSEEDDNTDAPSLPDGGSVTDPISPSHRSRRKFVVWGFLAFVLIVAGSALLVVHVVKNAEAIPLGPGSATVSWVATTSETPTPQHFVGTAAGLGVTGTAKQPNATSNLPTITAGAPTFPSKISIFHVTGTIDGKHFTLDPYFTFGSELNTLSQGGTVTTTPLQPSTCTPTSSSTQIAGFECTEQTALEGHPTPSQKPKPFVIGRATGSYGSLRVKAALTAQTDIRLGFTGSIGAFHITGVIENIVRHAKTETAHAVFKVTK